MALSGLARAEPAPIADLEPRAVDRPAQVRGVGALDSMAGVIFVRQSYAEGWGTHAIHRFEVSGGLVRRGAIEVPIRYDRSLGAHGGWHYFLGIRDGTIPRERPLLRTDGARVVPLLEGLSEAGWAFLGGVPYVAGWEGSDAAGLYRLGPPGANEVRRITDLGIYASAPVAAADRLYLSVVSQDGAPRRLVRSDGTPMGTEEVDLGGAAPLLFASTQLGEGLVLWAQRGDRLELHRVESTGGSTLLLRGPVREGTPVLRGDGTRAWFTQPSRSGADVRDLWVTDGTPVGTGTTGVSGPSLTVLGAAGGTVVLGERSTLRVLGPDGAETARFERGGGASWRSATDVGGAFVVSLHNADLRELHLLREGRLEVIRGSRSGSPPVWTRLGDLLVVLGAEPPAWVASLTYGGGEPVYGLHPVERPSGSSAPSFFGGLDQVALVRTQVGGDRQVLWSTDGRSFRQLRLGSFLEARAFRGRYYWLERRDDLGVELFGWDPETDLIRRIRAFAADPWGAGDLRLAVLSDALLVSGTRVLLSDGTADGTADLVSRVGAEDAALLAHAPGGAALAFTRTGGTLHLLGRARTASVAFPEGSEPRAAAPAVGGFVVLDGAGRAFVLSLEGRLELIAERGFDPEREIVSGLGEASGRSVFVVRTFAPGRSSALLFFDARESAFARSNPVGATVLPDGLAIDGRLFFFSREESRLWVTDGTPEGTRSLADADVGGLRPALDAVNGLALFPGVDDEAGVEPWISDGTLAGTRRLADIAPGQAPGALGLAAGLRAAVVGETLVFPGYDRTAGVEPWAIDLGALPCNLACCTDRDCPEGPCVRSACAPASSGNPPSASSGEPLPAEEGCGCRSRPGPAPSSSSLPAIGVFLAFFWAFLRRRSDGAGVGVAAGSSRRTPPAGHQAHRRGG